MPVVSFIYPDGTKKDVEISQGQNAMKGAISNGVKGIIAECGGSAMCGTCHVYVDDAYLDRLSPIGMDEDAMLDATSSPRQHNSRLSCQIMISGSLDGLIVQIPETQT